MHPGDTHALDRHELNHYDGESTGIWRSWARVLISQARGWHCLSRRWGSADAVALRAPSLTGATVRPRQALAICPSRSVHCRIGAAPQHYTVDLIFGDHVRGDRLIEGYLSWDTVFDPHGLQLGDGEQRPPQVDGVELEEGGRGQQQRVGAVNYEASPFGSVVAFRHRCVRYTSSARRKTSKMLY